MTIPIALAMAGTAVSVVGAVSQANAATQNAKAQERLAEVNAINARNIAKRNADLATNQAMLNERAANKAANLNIEGAAGQANAYQASAQRQAEIARRKGMIMLSRAQAVSGASGGGPLDESLISGILNESELASNNALFEGQSRAETAMYSANINAYNVGQQGAMNTLYTQQQGAANLETTSIQGDYNVASAAAQTQAAENAKSATIAGSVAQAGLGLSNSFGGYTPASTLNGGGGIGSISGFGRFAPNT